MAENEKEKKGDKDKKESIEEQPKKKSPVKLIIILVSVVVILGGGAVAFFMLSKGDAAIQDKQSSAGKVNKDEQESKSLGPVVMLDPFIVNLSGTAGRRYLKVSIGLELNGTKVEEEIDNRMPQLRDSILLHMSTKTLEDIESGQGKIILRDEILTRLNGFLTSGLIKKIYFTDFVVQ